MVSSRLLKSSTSPTTAPSTPSCRCSCLQLLLRERSSCVASPVSSLTRTHGPEESAVTSGSESDASAEFSASCAATQMPCNVGATKRLKRHMIGWLCDSCKKGRHFLFPCRPVSQKYKRQRGWLSLCHDGVQCAFWASLRVSVLLVAMHAQVHLYLSLLGMHEHHLRGIQSVIIK